VKSGDLLPERPVAPPCEVDIN